MAKIRLEVFEGGTASATIIVPIWLVAGASEFLPRLGGKRIEEHIDLARLRAMIESPGNGGMILEIEDHDSNERVVISIVDREIAAARA